MAREFGTQFDSLRLGAGKPRGNQASPGAAATGVYVYSIVPEANTTTALAANQVASGAALTLTAGPTVTTQTYNGTTEYVLDVPRNVSIVGGAGSTTSTNFTVVGRDVYGVAMSETFAGPTGTGTTQGAKAFKYVQSITAVGNTTSGVSAGTSSTLGLPYRIDDFGQLVINVNDVLITSSAGFTAADATTATATTGDTRGTYAAQTAPDGLVKFYFWLGLTDPSTSDKVYGVLQA